MNLSESIFAELARHVGQENAIGAAELAALVGTHEREVRRVIAKEGMAWARERGAMLLSSAGLGGGFYIATEAEEALRKRKALLREEWAAIHRRKEFDELLRAIGLGGLIHQTEVPA